MEVWENEKCCGNTSHRRVFRQLFRVLPNLHECFCNSIETRRKCFLFLLENSPRKITKNEENLIVLFIIKTYILYATQCTHHLNLNFFVFLSSYRNTIINQSAHLFSLSYFLINNKNSFALFSWAIFMFVHFAAALDLSVSLNSLFCRVCGWRQQFKFLFLSLHYSNHDSTHFVSQTISLSFASLCLSSQLFADGNIILYLHTNACCNYKLHVKKSNFMISKPWQNSRTLSFVVTLVLLTHTQTLRNFGY